MGQDRRSFGAVKRLSGRGLAALKKEQGRRPRRHVLVCLLYGAPVTCAPVQGSHDRAPLRIPVKFGHVPSPRGSTHRRGGGGMKNKITGRPAVLALVKDQGGKHLFGKPGTTELPGMYRPKGHPD